MKPRALIVDDSLTIRMDLADSLGGAGFETVQCSTVAEAARQLDLAAFDVVILDVILPDGDGLDLLKQIRASMRTRRTPVLLLSTEVEVRDRIRGLKTGADEYVGKPYDSAYVTARARQLIQPAEPGPADVPPTILIVDDSLTYREEMSRTLKETGYAVLAAASGEEGLRTAIAARPAAVIVDGVLPGIDGAGVIRRIRQDTVLRHTPCMLLTAVDSRADELQALDAGADAFVRKESDTKVLLLRLAAMLRSARPPAHPVPAGAASLLSPKRVLAVDDSPTYLHRLADELRQEGYDVVTACSGEEAIDLLAVQTPDCILLDLLMPGLSGYETCRRIKGAAPLRDVPLIILSAEAEREAMIEGINAGADDYIPKSSEFDVVKARLRAQLRRKQFEDENRSIREELLRKEVEAAEARAAGEVARNRAKLLTELEQKNKELEGFSYSVSHDLRAPLRAVDGFCHILVEEHGAKLDPEARHCIDSILRNVRRMSMLIDDLLRFSRMGRQSLMPVELEIGGLARDVFEELRAQSPGRNVEFKVGATPPVTADRAMMLQVLTNLLSNALKYSAPRNPAVIEVGCDATHAEDVFFVRDNGVGFDMQYAGKLFGVFQRLHSAKEFEGTGVGLALVQRIVQRHGGRVWADAAVDKGTTIFFTLPRPGDENAAGPTHQGANEHAVGGVAA